MFKHTIIVLIVFSIILLGGCSEQRGNNLQEDLKNNIAENKERLEDEYPFHSEIVISPDNTKLLFISPFEWEEIGEIYLNDLRDSKIEKILSKEDMKPENTPKKVLWLDNDTILIIIGYAFGTTDSGGDLFYYDINNKNIKKVNTINLIGDINNIIIDDGKLYLEIIKYNEDSTSYELYRKVKELDSIEIENQWDIDKWEDEREQK